MQNLICLTIHSGIPSTLLLDIRSETGTVSCVTLSEGSKVMRTKCNWNFMKYSKERHLKCIGGILSVDVVEMKLQ